MSTGRPPAREYDLQQQIFIIVLIVGAALIVGLLLIALVSSPGAAVPAPAGMVSSPNAQTVLSRAEEAAALALTTSEQTARSIELVTNVTTILGTIIGALILVTAAIAGFFGLSNQRELREERERVREEERKVQGLEARVERQAQELDRERHEFDAFKVQVRKDFNAMGQALGLIDFGNRLYFEGKHMQALPIYEEAARLDPDNLQVHYRLGSVYSSVERYDAAINELEKAVALQPNFPEAYMELGLVHRRRGDYVLAEQKLREAIALRPQYEDALAALGGLYRRQGRYTEALGQYQAAFIVDDSSSYAAGNIAGLAWFLGQPDLAFQFFQKVEVLATARIEAGREEPQWPLYDRALARLVLGRVAEALADHRAALDLTTSAENARSVLDNLLFLNAAPRQIPGLDQLIEMIYEKFPLLAARTTS